MKSKLIDIDEDLTDVGPHWKQTVLQALTIEDVLAYFQPKDVLARFQPKDLLAQVKPEDIENYLTQRKQSSRASTAKTKTKKKKVV